MSGRKLLVPACILVSVAAMSWSCTSFDASPVEDAGTSPEAGVTDGAAFAPDAPSPDPNRWCSERQAPPGTTIALCDDFDSPDPVWQWSPPWDPDRTRIGDGSLERASGGLTSGAWAMKASALPANDEARFQLAKRNVAASSVVFAFDVRVDEIADFDATPPEVEVARVSHGNGSQILSIVYKRGPDGQLHGSLHHGQLNQVFDYQEANPLPFGRTHRVALAIERGPAAASFELTVDDEVVVGKGDFDLSGTTFDFELGVRVGPSVSATATFDDVTVETH